MIKKKLSILAYFNNTFEKFYKFVKITCIVILIFVNSIQFIFFNKEISYKFNCYIYTAIMILFNLRIKLKGNVNYLQDANMLILSNHYEGMDFIVIKNSIHCSKKLFAVCKHNVFGDVNDKNKLFDFLSFFKNSIYASNNFIPYIRGKKEDGEAVKNIILEKIKKDNILVFPEGTSYKNGAPKEFKNGIFHLASDNNFTILPITLIYGSEFGAGRGEPTDLYDWFNLECEVYVHEKITGNNWLQLKENTFNAINDCYQKHKKF